MADNATIRFLTLKGQQCALSFPSSTDFSTIKKSLQDSWPAEFDALQSGSELKFIHGGKFMQDTDTVKDLNFPTNGVVTVHISVKPPQASEEPTHNPEESVDYHLHGFIFDELEADEIATIFNRKKDSNNQITFDQLKQFLHKYWMFMKRTNNEDQSQTFPEARLNSCWEKMSGEDKTKVDINQFRAMFFLFCNTAAADTICPHGQKERIQEATSQLHRQFPQVTFQGDIFESLFKRLDQDHDGILTCAESELLFYLYSAEVIKKVPAESSEPPTAGSGQF